MTNSEQPDPEPQPSVSTTAITPSAPPDSTPDAQKTNGELQGGDHQWYRSHKVQVWIAIAGTVYCALTLLLWWTTREGIHAGQRAYVQVNEAHIVREIGLTEGEVSIALRNTGNTPALNVRHASMTALAVSAAEGRLAAFSSPLSESFDLGAGQTATARVVIPPIPADAWRSVESGQRRFFLRFRIVYDDVFQSGLSRWFWPNETMNCAELERTTKLFISCGTTVK